MHFDVYGAPPELAFGDGAETFKLILNRPTASDRMMIFDAAREASYVALHHACERMVAGWVNVCNVDGTPIPFVREDGHGNKIRQYNTVMGGAPLTMQLRVMGAILAFCGIPSAAIQEIIGALDQEAALGIDPTFAPAGDTPIGASKS